jgi:hypothetical protein
MHETILILICATTVGCGATLPSFINPSTCDMAAEMVRNEIKHCEKAKPENVAVCKAGLNSLIDFGKEAGCHHPEFEEASNGGA